MAGGIVKILTQLKLSLLDDEWVKSAWESGFIDPEPVPADFEDTLAHDSIRKELSQLDDELQQWVHGIHGDSGEGLWTILVENDVSHKKLVAFLFAVIQFWKQSSCSTELRLASASAAQVYLTLLRVPGSGAFKVYHEEIYEHVLGILKSWESLASSKRKLTVTSSQRSTASRGRKKRSKESDDDMDTDEDCDDEEDIEEGIPPQDLETLQKSLRKLLVSLVKFLQSFSLKSCELGLDRTAHCLVKLTRLDPDSSAAKLSLEGDPQKFKSVMQLAYKGLQLLCSELHGELKDTSLLTFRLLLPSVLMKFGDDNKGIAAQSIPRAIQLIAQHAVEFINLLLESAAEGYSSSARILLQHMCIKVPDKAEYRSKVAENVVTIYHQLHATDKAAMMAWIPKFAKNAKISYRGFALDLIAILMTGHQVTEETGNGREMSVGGLHSIDDATQRSLIHLLIGRCSDVSPSVRARAIATLAQCTYSSEPRLKQTMQDMMTPGGATRPAVTRIVPTPDIVRVLPLSAPPSSTDPTPQAEPSTIATESGSQSSEGPLLTPNTTSQESATPQFVTPSLSTADTSLPDGHGLVSMLRRRAGDEKVNVRKAAIQALEAFVRLQPSALQQGNLSVIAERCRDPALSVRKQAMTGLTSLLEGYPLDPQMQRMWLSGILPLVIDRETTVQEKCLDFLQEMIFSNIVPHDRMSSDFHLLAWNILNFLAMDENAQERPYLQKACVLMGKKGSFKMPFYRALESHVNTENNVGAWMLLSHTAAYAPKIDTSFIVNYWKERVQAIAETDYFTIQCVLSTLSVCAKKVAQEDIQELVDDFKSRLMEFVLPPQVTTSIITTLSKLCQSLDGQSETSTQRNTHMWFSGLLQECDNFLSKTILSNEEGSQCNEAQLVSYLFTLGEIAQLCPDKVPKRVYMLVLSLIASPSITSIDGSSQSSASQDQAVAQQTSGSQEFEVLSQFRGSKMSPKIRAYAFVTLGKLCLQNEDLAKSVIAALSRELDTSPHIAIRNNIIVVMSDLCIRYTNMVDRHVSTMACCLRDSSSLIRKQTLTLLTRLLQEDYLKWKGPLFYHYAIALVDENKDIAEFCQFCLVHLLLQRHPTMFFNHFVECIYHYNAYEDHKTYNKFTQSDKETKLFSLEGKEHADKRMKIYRFLLEHMNDSHKFQLTAKLTQDILGAVVDETIPLNAKTSSLLEDTFKVLVCKEIKLSSLRSSTQEDMPDTEAELAAAVARVAKKNLISQVMKKNVIENIIPTVVSLKRMLEKNHSPVLKYLMLYLCDLFKEYKNEVKDFLAADQQLAVEIEYDMKRFEEQRHQTQRLNASSSDIQTPTVAPGIPKSPAVIKTPCASPGPSKSSATPVRTPRPSTKKRAPALSTLAVLNSARRAMATKSQAGASPHPPASPGPVCQLPLTPKSDHRRGSADRSKHVGWADDSISSDEAFSPHQQGITTPGRNRMCRAISTPSGNITLGNITFMQGDSNLSMIAPSPLHVPGGKENRAIRKSSRNVKEAPQDIILMASPEQPRPKPKVWNIKATDPKDAGERLQMSEDESTSPSDPPSKPSRRARQSPRSSDASKKAPEGTSTRRQSSRKGRGSSSAADSNSNDSIASRTRRQSSRRS